MKFRTLVSAATLAAVTAVPMVSVSAADTSSVTIVDGYQYDANNLQSHTVCVDGAMVKHGTDILSHVDLAPGSHHLTVSGDDVSCDETDTMWYSATVTVADVPSQSITFGWPEWRDSQDPFLPTWQHSNPTTCTPDDQGRIILRNVVSAEGEDASLGASYLEEGLTPLIGAVPVGGEGSALVAPPEYPAVDSEWTLRGWTGDEASPRMMLVPDGSLPVEAGSTTITYAFGGADGEIGLVYEQVPDGPCGEATTTTTTTSVPGKVSDDHLTPVATPVVAQPAYTG